MLSVTKVCIIPSYVRKTYLLPKPVFPTNEGTGIFFPAGLTRPLPEAKRAVTDNCHAYLHYLPTLLLSKTISERSGRQLMQASASCRYDR